MLQNDVRNNNIEWKKPQIQNNNFVIFFYLNLRKIFAKLQKTCWLRIVIDTAKFFAHDTSTTETMV